MNVAPVPCTQGKRRKLTSNLIDFDCICKLLKVSTWEQIEDGVSEWCPWNPEATEEENLAAEEAQRDEDFRNYYNAVMHVAEHVFGEHGLALEGVKVRRKRVDYPWEFRILPKHERGDWKDAASHLRQTIDGVGVFVFGSLRNFLSSGPYTAREAVLQHLGWIADWYRVYEGSTAGAHVEAYRR